MDERTGLRIQRWLLGVIATVLVLVLLVQAAFFLIPLAVALLLFGLTTAMIDAVAKVRVGPFAIPYWLASFVAVAIVATVLLGLFGIISAQTDVVIATAATYTERGEATFAALFSFFGDEVSAAVLSAFQDIDFGSYLRAFAGSAGNLLIATVLVILYVGFLFAERPWFERKLSLLFPQPDRALEVQKIFTAIMRSLRHYILIKTAVSLVTALTVYAVMLLFGLDFAIALAILTFLLNFIPNIGSLIASLLPAMVALAQFGQWSMMAAVLAVVGTIQFSIGNIVEPMLMGRTLSLSSFAIILSLTFWGALWGVAGLFLAVPIMMMIMIVCANVPMLKPVAVLLSRDGTPVLR